ncbi:MAG: hypothetical protein ABSA18_12795 [Dehalococcoidia bacterium]|jgi:hypothetical protein
MKTSLPLYDRNGQPAASFKSIERENDKLVMEAKALDVMDVEVVITPSSFLKMVAIVFSWPVISFILLLPYFGLRRLFHRS